MAQPAFIGNHPLQFGTRVKNKITGDEGIVTAKFYLISGCVTCYYTSQKLRDQNNKPIKHYDTVNILDVVGENETFSEQPKEESNFSLGERVKVPTYGGVEAVVTAIAFYPDQATHVEVQPPYNEKEGKLPDSMSLAASLVVSLDNPPAKPTPAERRPSPPSDMSERQSQSRADEGRPRF